MNNGPYVLSPVRNVSNHANNEVWDHGDPLGGP